MPRIEVKALVGVGRACATITNRVPFAEYQVGLRDAGMPIVAPLGPPNLEPRDDISPSERAPVFRAADGGVRLAQLSWCFEPSSPKARRVINFKPEGRSFANSKRCLVPATEFYEFKGAKAPKAKFKFSLAVQPWFCFAGLWRCSEEEGGIDTFTLLTTAPGPAVAPVHDRQMGVLQPGNWRSWLDLTKPEAELLAPLPAGSLRVEQVR
jgi:putative SOS response-associated peptidase YedK